MPKTYQIILDKKSAKEFRTHLRNMGVKHIGSECGEAVCVQFEYEEKDILDIEILLTRVTSAQWVEALSNINK